jgi:hypothetical protein
MKYILFLFLILFSSDVFAYTFITHHKIGDIISPSISTGCGDCSPTNTYIVTGTHSFYTFSQSVSTLADYMSIVQTSYPTVVNGVDLISVNYYENQAAAISYPTTLKFYRINYKVSALETFLKRSDIYTVNPSLALAYATQPNGVITQTISFLVGAFTSMAFVIAAKRFT